MVFSSAQKTGFVSTEPNVSFAAVDSKSDGIVEIEYTKESSGTTKPTKIQAMLARKVDVHSGVC